MTLCIRLSMAPWRKKQNACIQNINCATTHKWAHRAEEITMHVTNLQSNHFV